MSASTLTNGICLRAETPLAMLKWMDDLRAFFDGDVRWLKHYGEIRHQPTLSGGVGASS
jgi:hypothetical protein